MSTKTANQIFTEVYGVIDIEVPFDPQWNNGTGYMDHAMKHEFDLPVGTMVKSHTGQKNNRRVIIIVMPKGVGHVVVFDRYTETKGVFGHNTPLMLEQLMRLHSAWDGDQMLTVLGDAFHVNRMSSTGELTGDNLAFRFVNLLNHLGRSDALTEQVVQANAVYKAKRAARKQQAEVSL